MGMVLGDGRVYWGDGGWRIGDKVEAEEKGWVTVGEVRAGCKGDGEFRAKVLS